MRAFIAMGSNMGDRKEYVKRALEEIEKRAGHIIAKSSLIETKAYGYTEQDDFLNLAIEINTTLTPHELLDELLKIELELDRVRVVHWGPRTIDLDIIYYEDYIIDEENLHIPHIDLYNRDFVLGPIAEIDPDFKDPRKNETVSNLLEKLKIKNSKEFMESRKNLGMTLGLDRIKEALESLGNPQDTLKVIHVAGTNGKGSIATFINNALISNGYRVGITNSPRIEVENDRYRINNNNITDKDLAEYILKLKPLVDKMDYEGKKLSSFEIETLFTILYFVDNNVDFAIFEVGLGGRLDSTNIFKHKMVNVFTQIGFDHMGFLGDTLKKITDHKSDIIMNNDKSVSYPNNEEVLKELKRKVNLKNGELFIVDKKDLKVIESSVDKQVFDYLGYENVEVDLLGKHQILNATTALLTLEVLKKEGVFLDDKKSIEGFKNTKWPGRLEKVKNNILLDGAHNIDAVNALCDFLKTSGYNKILVLMGTLKDKEYVKIADIMSELPADFIITKVNFPGRELEPEILKNEFIRNGKNAIAIQGVSDAVKRALIEKDNYDLMIVCGSLYLIDEIKSRGLI